jgi:hypothetical protein
LSKLIAFAKFSKKDIALGGPYRYPWFCRKKEKEEERKRKRKEEMRRKGTGGKGLFVVWGYSSNNGLRHR